MICAVSILGGKSGSGRTCPTGRSSQRRSALDALFELYTHSVIENKQDPYLDRSIMSPGLTIERATVEDAPRFHQISHDSFTDDAHTAFKVWEKGSEDSSGEMPLDLIESWITRDQSRCAVIKAVNADGTILGWSAWGLSNLDGSKKAVGPRNARTMDVSLMRSCSPRLTHLWSLSTHRSAAQTSLTTRHSLPSTA